MKTVLILLALVLAVSPLYADNGDLIVSGKLGVGVTGTPSNRVQIIDTVTNQTLNTEYLVGYYNSTISGGPWYNKGLSFATFPFVASDVINNGYVIGLDCTNYTVDSASTGTLGSIMGARFQPGIFAGAAHLTSIYGLSVNVQAKAGQIGSTYGLYLSQAPGGVVTNGWGIYQATAQNNYLAGNLAVGTTDLGTGGTKALLFGNGAKPTGLSNVAGIYAKDVEGTTELNTFDEAGNETQQTPHASDAPEWMYDPDDGVPMIFKEIQHFLGYVRYTNITRQARLVGMTDAEKSTLNPQQRTCVFRESFDAHNERLGKTGDDALVRLDWYAEQTKIAANRDAQIATAKAAKANLDARMAADKGDQLSKTDLEPESSAAEVPDPYIIKEIPLRLKTAIEAGK